MKLVYSRMHFPTCLTFSFHQMIFSLTGVENTTKVENEVGVGSSQRCDTELVESLVIV